jgi:predicted amidophosphoribosyltransferase
MFRVVTELLALPRCTGCGAHGPEWCDRCALLLPDVRWHLIDHELPLCTTFPYDGPIRRTIIDWKEQQHRAAATRIATWFRVGLEPLLDSRPDIVCVPIPSSPANDRLRGGAVLTEVLQSAGLPISTALIAARARNDQSGLSRSEREMNMHDAFSWTGNATVVIVDDVVTSGATMRAAARAIRTCGGRVWAGFGLARRGRLATIQASGQGIAWGYPIQGGMP